MKCPVRLLHGLKDLDVPWLDSVKLAEHICHEDTEVCLIKEGDHRLSRPDDVVRLIRQVDVLCTMADEQGGE
eukprot:CAMPEP_0171140656 /NCGR_PEP_ID=MMETSP0766_2-20121228/139170_1 /TAXON_ID=439317 /ORGANISM="Gambierdiscus australes, Strain CAWD 149" /LENGTH=71 /DNA_ID=CAMNT_0011604357 /DNA_START=103 /DNA_END=318 /DNA_ORIENTATION=-